MSHYTPDRWVMLKIHSKDHGTIFRVFAGWLGGYAAGDSWKLSSGNTAIIDHTDHYEIPQESGSVYVCNHARVGMTSYMASVIKHWQTTIMTDGSTVEIVDIEEARTALK